MKFFSTHKTIKSVLGMIEMLENKTTKKIREYHLKKNAERLWDLFITEF